MSDMTEQEAWELDELLTNTIPKISPTVEGPFIKHRNMMVVLDRFSAQYLTAKMPILTSSVVSFYQKDRNAFLFGKQ